MDENHRERTQDTRRVELNKAVGQSEVHVVVVVGDVAGGAQEEHA